MAIAIGTHPPYQILMTFAANSEMSIVRNASMIGRTWASDQFQRDRATTAKRSDVIAIVPVTAMPYAAPIACEDPNATTRTIHPIMRMLLISGTKIWPASLRDV